MSDIKAHERETFDILRGSAPLLVSVPHSGSLIPDDLIASMSDHALGSVDTDWFMRELYTPIVEHLGGSLISPKLSRYVIDLNRPESDESLYPGQTTTGLCPLVRFDGQPLYLKETPLTIEEKERRLDLYWRPYHHALRAELSRLVSLHGSVLLWEGHSIKSIVPRLFEGKLPEINIGTNSGKSCAPSIEEKIRVFLKDQEGTESAYTSVINGRFKGGYITRAYGVPLRGVHAVQLELSQSTYLEAETSPTWSPTIAAKISTFIEGMMSVSLEALSNLNKEQR